MSLDNVALAEQILPEALERALGDVFKNIRHEWEREHELALAKRDAVIANLERRNLELETEVRNVVAGLVAKVEERVASLKDGKDGKDGIDGKDGVDGKDGKDGKDGINGENGIAGKDGKDGVDGKDGAAGKDGKDGIDGMHGLPGPQGETGEKGIPGDDGAPGKDGKDGTGLAGAFIDRGGFLVLTLSSGEVVRLDCVVGKDGADGLPGKEGKNGKDGKDGRDGLGFEDIIIEDDGKQSITIKFIRGDTTIERKVTFPVLVYCGVYEEGKEYQKGNCVTWGGSLYHCNEMTVEKPGSGSKDWTLAVKRGADGRDRTNR